jgi:hypothetical protein
MMIVKSGFATEDKMKHKHFITGLILTTLISGLVWLGIRKCGCAKNNVEEYGAEGEEGEERLEVRVVLD